MHSHYNYVVVGERTKCYRDVDISVEYGTRLRAGLPPFFHTFDHHDREIIGYRTSKEGTARAALDALEMATVNRFGALKKGIVPDIELKLDHGCQNTAHLFMNEARWAGV